MDYIRLCQEVPGAQSVISPAKAASLDIASAASSLGLNAQFVMVKASAQLGILQACLIKSHHLCPIIATVATISGVGAKNVDMVATRDACRFGGVWKKAKVYAPALAACVIACLG